MTDKLRQQFKTSIAALCSLGDIPDMSSEEMNLICNNFDHYTVKARRDERKAVLAEIEGWLVDEEYPITDPDSIDYGKMLASPKNDWNAELRAKLAEMKTSTVVDEPKGER